MKRSTFRNLGIKISRALLFLSQSALVPFMWFLVNVVIRVKVHLRTPLSTKRRGVLIISNHQSWYDPFLVNYLVAVNGYSVQHFFHSIPLWFPTRADIIRNFPLGTIIRLLGAYDIGETSLERARGLLFTRHLLKQSENVLLFPEAKCIRVGDKVEPFHPGINALLLEPIPVILVRMRGVNRWSWGNFSQRYQCEIELMQIEGLCSQEEKLEAVQAFYA